MTKLESNKALLGGDIRSMVIDALDDESQDEQEMVQDTNFPQPGKQTIREVESALSSLFEGTSTAPVRNMKTEMSQARSEVLLFVDNREKRN